jgi:hypothetical protein
MAVLHKISDGFSVNAGWFAARACIGGSFFDRILTVEQKA